MTRFTALVLSVFVSVFVLDPQTSPLAGESGTRDLSIGGGSVVWGQGNQVPGFVFPPDGTAIVYERHNQGEDAVIVLRPWGRR